MKLEDAEKDMVVIYKPWPEAPPEQWERGVVTSKNHVNIFVRYGKDLHSKATTPSDIEPEFGYGRTDKGTD